MYGFCIKRMATYIENGNRLCMHTHAQTMHAHTCMHSHACMHTHTHTHIHTHTHLYYS